MAILEACRNVIRRSDLGWDFTIQYMAPLTPGAIVNAACCIVSIFTIFA